MLAGEVKTIKDLIFYRYSKIIAHSAFSSDGEKDAKSKYYEFIKKTFRELQNGSKTWSDITSKDQQLLESGERCVYCGDNWQLNKEHIVHESLKIKPKCTDCPRLHAIHNMIWTCQTCNYEKGKMGLYEFFRSRHPGERKFYDLVPSMAEKKYLKTIYYCHQCSNTLNKGDIDGDGNISVLDIDYILH